MPLTTRCRRCGRLFPVYAQQLKERRGKADCPQCGNRFNAVAALLDEPIPGGTQGNGRPVGGRRRPAAPPSTDFMTMPGPGRRPRLYALLWLPAILLLAGTLVLQAAWWERGYWLSDPKFRASLDQACAAVGCRLPLPRLPGTIEILAPTLGVHPEDPQALRLMLTLISRAEIPQRLPLLQLELYDEAGELAAARRLTPASYLPDAPRTGGLSPGVAMNLMLDLAMPPQAPAGFRIRLL